MGSQPDTRQAQGIPPRMPACRVCVIVFTHHLLNCRLIPFLPQRAAGNPNPDRYLQQKYAAMHDLQEGKDELRERGVAWGLGSGWGEGWVGVIA